MFSEVAASASFSWQNEANTVGSDWISGRETIYTVPEEEPTATAASTSENVSFDNGASGVIVNEARGAYIDRNNNDMRHKA